MFSWIPDLINGVGDSIGSALSSAWESISDSIWGKFIAWIYTLVYDAISGFLTLITNMGADLFELPWVESALEFFSLFGWGLFLAGLVVAIFDTLITQFKTTRTFIYTACYRTVAFTRPWGIYSHY